ncbi:hypothetical protein [Phycicoccus avicenniae]|uniref:hypothetical protein n=1 Tax=Phycicoccus avicenniae TaxID=2828860 RepID=UPI003D2694AC
MPEPDAPEVPEDVDGDTVPRSRLRAAWGPPEAPAPTPVVRDAPEPARPATRRTGEGLEQRIAPWAVPASGRGDTAPADGPGPPRPQSPTATEGPTDAPARTPLVESAPRAGTVSRTRTERHAMYAPPRDAVDLAPERPTPLTDPPRRLRRLFRR